MILSEALASAGSGSHWSSVLPAVRSVVRFLSVHTGVPALFVAAVLLCVAYRIVKRTARFALQVAAVTVSLLVATELGWICW